LNAVAEQSVPNGLTVSANYRKHIENTEVNRNPMMAGIYVASSLLVGMVGEIPMALNPTLAK
jgi:hypothetical protein